MEDIALAALPRDVESDAESEASSERTASSRKSHTILPGLLGESKSEILPEGALPPFAEPSTGISPPLPKLPAGWISQWDNSSRKYYYVQISTGVSQWELPEVETLQLPLPPGVVEDLLPGHPCKVYDLRGNDWFDLGSGCCICTTVPSGEPRIVVLSKGQPGTSVLVHPTTDHGFRKQQDTLLVWTRMNGTNMALSFQEPAGCAECWEFINRCWPQSKSEEIPYPNSKDDTSRTISSDWTILERAEFRGHVEYYGTNWAAIAYVMGTKTTTMISDHYSQLLSEGDTELQRLAANTDRKRHESGAEEVLLIQLRQELDEKVMRIVQLEQAVEALAVDALQQGRQTLLTRPFSPASLTYPPTFPNTSHVDWVRQQHVKGDSRLRQLEQTIMELQKRRAQQPLQSIYACEFCVQVFRSADDLNSHRAIHSASSGGSSSDILTPQRQEVLRSRSRLRVDSEEEQVRPVDAPSPSASDVSHQPAPAPGFRPQTRRTSRSTLTTKEPDLGPIQLPPLLKANFPGENDVEEQKEESVIKCICGFSDDDGNTVLCKECDTWQHIVCYYESAQHVPDVHECADCLPRLVDPKAAKEHQTKRREQWAAAYGKHQCTECGQAFTGADDLRRHHEQHERDRVPGPHTFNTDPPSHDSLHQLASLEVTPKVSQQQQRLAAASQMLRQNPGIVHATDAKPFPPNMLNVATQSSLPLDVRSWQQLKIWASENPALCPGVDPQKLLLLQVLHFQDMVRASGESSAAEEMPMGKMTQAQAQQLQAIRDMPLGQGFPVSLPPHLQQLQQLQQQQMNPQHQTVAQAQAAYLEHQKQQQQLLLQHQQQQANFRRYQEQHEQANVPRPHSFIGPQLRDSTQTPASLGEPPKEHPASTDKGFRLIVNQSDGGMEPRRLRASCDSCSLAKVSVCSTSISTHIKKY
jgi:hypothetical protein